MSNNEKSSDRFFGLDRERKIEKSGIREIFTPHTPVSQEELLFGRQVEVRKLVETLNTPGQHVLLYGERGIGKSSLANIVALLFPLISDSKLFVKRCDGSETFESIFSGPLTEVGADLTLANVSKEVSTTLSANIKIAGGERSKSVVQSYESNRKLSPSTVAEAIGGLNALLIIDETDAIGNDEKSKLAEVIKLLSDRGSKFKIMVVGIAEVGNELTAAHPSVLRCLRETQLNRMSNPELRDILTVGGSKAKIAFEEDVMNSIVELSGGLPYFTHLIGLKCAEDAIAADRETINAVHLQEALVRAVSDAEVTLTRDFESATRSADKPLYRQIVEAAASLRSEEFTAQDLRAAIQRVSGSKTAIPQLLLNNYYKRLVSDNDPTILRRTSKGIYRFADPRMPSYVRMHTAIRKS